MTNNLLEEIKLRRLIRKVIILREEKILQERKEIMLEERGLRKVIRHLLTEELATGITYTRAFTIFFFH